MATTLVSLRKAMLGILVRQINSLFLLSRLDLFFPSARETLYISRHSLWLESKTVEATGPQEQWKWWSGTTKGLLKRRFVSLDMVCDWEHNNRWCNKTPYPSYRSLRPVKKKDWKRLDQLSLFRSNFIAIFSVSFTSSSAAILTDTLWPPTDLSLRLKRSLCEFTPDPGVVASPWEWNSMVV